MALAWHITHMLWKHFLSPQLSLYSSLSRDGVCFLFNFKIVRINILISSKRNKHLQRLEGHIPWKLPTVEQSSRQRACPESACRQSACVLGAGSPVSTFPKQREALVTEHAFPMAWRKESALVRAFSCCIWVFLNKSIVTTEGIPFITKANVLPWI